ncbi:MAG: hypothetical protein RLY31_2563 [Bacteroidota bacterium]
MVAGWLSSPLVGQVDARFTGTVLEAGSGLPLVGATVQVGPDGAVTGVEGGFDLSLPAGRWPVLVSYIGYEPVQDTIILGAGGAVERSYRLSETTNVLRTATVTSGKYERALGEVTVSLDVLKPSLINNTNQTSLSGLLDKVPGVTMVGDQANIRGGSGFSYGAGSRVLLLLDDIPILQADAGYPQWEDVPLESIEQVEVVKGAASALYGSSALNGIVNVRTSFARAEPQTRVAPFLTTFMAPRNKAAKWWDSPRYTAGASLSHKQRFGKLDVVGGAFYQRNESVNDSTYSRRGRVNTSLRYRLSDRLTVGLNANANRSEGSSFFFWGGLDSLLYRPGAPVSRSASLRFNLDPYLTYFDGADNRHKLMGRLFRVKNDNETSEADQSNRSDMYYGEYQFQRKMAGSGTVLTAGGVFIGTAVRAPLYGDTTFHSRNLAAYLQVDRTFFRHLRLSGGFRLESNTILTPEFLVYRNGGNVVWRDTVPGGEIRETKPVFRLGASYSLSPVTFLRASWGQGYRFPTIAEKFIYTLFGGTPIIPNTDLTSETGWSAELGLRQGFRWGGFNGFLDLAGFWSEYEDMMEFNIVLQGFPPPFQSRNVGDTRIRGLEAGITGKGAVAGWETTALIGYTYIDPRFKTFASLDSLLYGSAAFRETEAYRNALNSSVCSGDRSRCRNVLKYRFRHSFKWDVESRKGPVSIGLSAVYNSEMENIDEVFEALIVPGLRTYRQQNRRGNLVLGIRTAFHANDRLKCSLLCNNLTNEEYVSRPGRLEAPRNVTLRLDYTF